MRRRGFFITLEGPEGSGKSSQAKRLVGWLRRKGCRVEFVRDPGSTALGRALRNALLHSPATMSPLMEALLFIGGRVQLVEERIRPALRRGSVAVCDRFHDSTVVYQGDGGGVPAALLEHAGRRAIGGLMPSLTIVLDVPTEIGFRRLRRAHDRMERKTRAFHRRVRAGFLRLAKREPRRFVVINATQAPQAIASQIEAIVRRRL